MWTDYIYFEDVYFVYLHFSRPSPLLYFSVYACAAAVDAYRFSTSECYNIHHNGIALFQMKIETIVALEILQLRCETPGHLITYNMSSSKISLCSKINKKIKTF